MDYIDSFLLFRRVQINRKDCLKETNNLYLLTLLRHGSGNEITMDIKLKMIKRSVSHKKIYKALDILIAAGYARKTTGNRPTFHITEQGKQALKDFSDAVGAADYINYNKKAPISKNVRRPGL